MAPSSLEKLRQLTTELCRRDETRIAELELYHAFFSNIPIRTFVWTVNKDLGIVTKNRKSLCSSSNIMTNGSIKDAFSCQHMNEYNIEMHMKAFGGDAQTYISYEGTNSFLTTLIPDVSGGKVVRVHGCSWDITHLQAMIDVSLEAQGALQEKSPDLADKISSVYSNAPLVQLVLELRKQRG